MQKYRLLISYDGTLYAGWQIQPNAISIQGLLEEKLSLLCKANVRVMGAGRTDAGVHALGQVAHFTADLPMPHTQLHKALNNHLPEDIRIHDLYPVSSSFHSQYSAQSKIYHYHLWLEKTHDPFVHRYRHRPKMGINKECLQEAIPYFLGNHDFTTFANVGSSSKNTHRTLFRLEAIPQEGGLRLEFEGNGFLYKMVRNLVGTLLEVGARRRTASSIAELFKAKDRKKAPMSAPAKGLFLVKVNYTNIFSKEG